MMKNLNKVIWTENNVCINLDCWENCECGDPSECEIAKRYMLENGLNNSYEKIEDKQFNNDYECEED